MRRDRGRTGRYRREEERQREKERRERGEAEGAEGGALGKHQVRDQGLGLGLGLGLGPGSWRVGAVAGEGRRSGEVSQPSPPDHEPEVRGKKYKHNNC